MGLLTLTDAEWKAVPRVYTNRMMLIHYEAFDSMIARNLFRPATVVDLMGILHGVLIGRHPVTGGLCRYHYPRD
jgi:hypothetical protein